MPDINQIPGGAATQISQQSGGLVSVPQPETREEGLAIDRQRMGQAVMDANPEPVVEPPQEPIPVWEESGPLAEPDPITNKPQGDPYGDPLAVPDTEDPTAERVHFDFTDQDSGEIFRVFGDKGATREEALQFLQSVPEDNLEQYRISEGAESSLRDYGRASLEGNLWGWGTEATAVLGAAAAKVMGDDKPFGEIYSDILGTECIIYLCKVFKSSH
jgi:hypothetical protein